MLRPVSNLLIRFEDTSEGSSSTAVSQTAYSKFDSLRTENITVRKLLFWLY